jgi:hypothetical protein
MTNFPYVTQSRSANRHHIQYLYLYPHQGVAAASMPLKNREAILHDL